jgi:Ca2+-transporting ATPase
MDESLLTGESVPVRKFPSEAACRLDKPGGDDLPSVFSGTLVTAGQGIAEVVATGLSSELGKIGKALRQVHAEPTLLQKETDRIVKIFAIVGLMACATVVVVFALTRGGDWAHWRQGLLAGITLAMAVLPEEFPVVLTVFLALGAWRISRKNVLTRRMPAIETLGAATVLCVDKTGTLTQNRMGLRKLAIDGYAIDLTNLDGPLPEELHSLLESAILACKRDPFDPMERALFVARDRWLKNTEHVHPNWSLAREYPLTPGLLAVSHAWNTGNSDVAIVAAKGAPEAIFDLCHLSENQRQTHLKRASELAGEGLRVLGIARGENRIDHLPEGHHDLTFEYIGLIAFEDPLRITVPAAVAECQTAGVRVVMITGDYPITAQSIARQAGLRNSNAVLSGPELDHLSDAQLAQRVGSIQVFARVVPEQKLRIVAALKANHEIVAMTGDGVNDAPALKAAHIGIAMGARGTDVAREAASLVLLDDDFSSIVSAIGLGRRIFDNIKKTIAFILAVHLPIVGLSMLPVFFADWPLILLPVHIVFLELIIDPTCSLIFEAEAAEPNVMQRPPRKPNERLFSLPTVCVAILQGLSVLLVCFGVFLLARSDHSVNAARALTFTTLVVAFVVVILVNRSFTRSAIAMLYVTNTALLWVVLGASVFLTLALVVPVVQRLFHFAPLHAQDVIFSFTAGFICVMWFEILKLLKRGSSARKST